MTTKTEKKRRYYNFVLGSDFMPQHGMKVFGIGMGVCYRYPDLLMGGIMPEQNWRAIFDIFPPPAGTTIVLSTKSRLDVLCAVLLDFGQGIVREGKQAGFTKALPASAMAQCSDFLGRKGAPMQQVMDKINDIDDLLDVVGNYIFG